MGDITLYGDIDQRTAAYAATEMLTYADNHIVLMRMGMQRPLPTNKADTVTFRRPIPFAVSTVPLQEGVTPTPQKLQFEDVTVQVRQYGAWTQFSDWVIKTSEDPVLRTAVKLHGKQAGATAEQIVYAAVRGGTNVFYANGASRAAVNTPITLNKQRAVTRALAKQKAMKITEILEAGPDFETFPIAASWVAVANSDLESDIRNLPGFKPVEEYASRKLISPQEIGAVENVRYVLSADLAPFTDAGGAYAGSGTPMVSTTGTLSDVYPILYFGEEAFGVVPLKGEESMTPVVVNPKPVNGDPLGQRGSVGHKFAMAAVILNELWMARLEVAVTQL